MEIFQTTAKMQQSQMPMAKSGGMELNSTQSVQQIQKTQISDEKVSQINDQKTAKVDNQEQMNRLIDQLNRSLDPFNTSLRFGFDNNTDDFYVSVIDTQSNKILRRFPAEQAQAILPKMEEINGLLFDERG